MKPPLTGELSKNNTNNNEDKMLRRQSDDYKTSHYLPGNIQKTQEREREMVICV
jgi:hypothetical protein